MPLEARRLIYKDDRKDEFHVYTSQELERKDEIDLLRRKAISLYQLALELLERARTAAKNGNRVEANHWDVKAHECHLRGLAIEEEALKKHIQLLESIAQIEGWELPAKEGERDGD